MKFWIRTLYLFSAFVLTSIPHPTPKLRAGFLLFQNNGSSWLFLLWGIVPIPSHGIQVGLTIIRSSNPWANDPGLTNSITLFPRPPWLAIGWALDSNRANLSHYLELKHGPWVGRGRRALSSQAGSTWTYGWQWSSLLCGVSLTVEFNQAEVERTWWVPHPALDTVPAIFLLIFWASL